MIAVNLDPVYDHSAPGQIVGFKPFVSITRIDGAAVSNNHLAYTIRSHHHYADRELAWQDGERLGRESILADFPER